jgi:RNA 3'-terminal phosphate cyclase (ATP)
VTEVFTALGARGVAAEAVAESAASEAEAYLAAGVPVGEHLADQLLLPLALAGGGAFRSLPPSSHTRTQADVIRAFLGVETRMQEISEHVWEFEVRR